MRKIVNLIAVVAFINVFLVGMGRFAPGVEAGSKAGENIDKKKCVKENENPAPQILKFQEEGNSFKTTTLEKLKETVASQNITVNEAQSAGKRTYAGFKFLHFLHKIYGDDLSGYDTVEFVATDGYAASISLKTFEKLPAYLTFGYKDPEKKFIIVHDVTHKTWCVPLGPFYLVWDNLTDPGLFVGDKSTIWPYQVETINLYSFANKYAAIIPPSDSPSEVKDGFDSYKLYCLKCHTLKSLGGEIGPPLEAVLENFENQEKLRKLISDPKSVNPEAEMYVPFREKGKEKEKVIDSIITYLYFEAPEVFIFKPQKKMK